MKTTIESRSLGENKSNYTNASIRQMRQSDLSEPNTSSTQGSTGSNYGSNTDYKSGERDAMGYRVRGTSSGSHTNFRKGVTAGQIAAGVIAGASVGILAGILLAPEKGRDLRKQVRNSATRIGDKVTQSFSSTKEKVTSWTSKTGNSQTGTQNNITSQSSTEVNTTSTDPALGASGGSNAQRCL